MLWDVAARKRLADDPLPVTEGGVTGVAFSPDGKTIAAGYGGFGRDGAGGGVVLWDVATRKRLAGGPTPREGGPRQRRGLQPRRQDPRRRIQRRDARGGVVLWDVATRKRLADDSPPRERGRRQSAWPSAPTARPSRPASAYGARRPASGGVVLWDVATRKRLADDPSP